jgi:hypothetical protein
MRSRFAAAPWSKSLRLTSALGTAVLVVVGISAYRGIPMVSGMAHTLGLGIALALVATLLGSVFFTVTGYAVDEHGLHIERLLFSTRIPLDGLQRLWLDKDACSGSLRVFGNGGLFSFTGLFRNKQLGTYRLFATDLSRAVVLLLPQRVVVISPAGPDAFIAHMQQVFPGISGERAGPSA